MAKQYKVVTIFGGTGFLGRYVVRALAQKGFIIRVVTRRPQKAYFLKPAGNVGQITGEYCDYRDEASVGRAINGSDYVINLTGILFQKGRDDFEQVHVNIPSLIAKACHYHEVESFIHISALGCEESKSKYAKTKRAGEEAILNEFPQATILRPSLLFGPQDDFFNQFAALAQISPFLPLIGGGGTNFQPIYVGDVADIIVRLLDREDVKGQIFELGGPEVFSFKDLLQIMFEYTGQKRMLIPVPWIFARIKALFLSLLPKPLLTQDQITSLQTDNVCGADYPNAHDLGVPLTRLDTILPQYLSTYRTTE